MVEEKRVISLGFGFSGLFLLAMSLFNYSGITGNVTGIDGAVIGVNGISQYLAVFGIIFMVIAVAVEGYELKKHKEEKKKLKKKTARKKKDKKNKK